MDAVILRRGLLTMNVCVPVDWTDDQVEGFANVNNPTGISSDWGVVQEGDTVLDGDPERVQCADDSSKVHIVLSC